MVFMHTAFQEQTSRKLSIWAYFSGAQQACAERNLGLSYYVYTVSLNVVSTRIN